MASFGLSADKQNIATSEKKPICSKNKFLSFVGRYSPYRQLCHHCGNVNEVAGRGVGATSVCWLVISS